MAFLDTRSSFKGEGRNKILIYLQGLQLRNVNDAYKVFTKMGIDNIATLHEMESDDIKDLTSKIDIIPDRIKIRKSLKQLTNTQKSPLTGQMKLVVLGDSSVGKSSIIVRFVEGTFEEFRLPNIAATFLRKTMKVDNRTIELEIWDTAGQEKYRSLGALYYRKANAALIVYDITNNDTLDSAKKWIKEVQNMEGNHVIIAIAGNKLDLVSDKQVNTDEVKQFADDNGFIFFETSAKDNHNIQEIFQSISVEADKKGKIYKKSRNNNIIDIETETHNNTKSCKCNLI